MIGEISSFDIRNDWGIREWGIQRLFNYLTTIGSIGYFEVKNGILEAVACARFNKLDDVHNRVLLKDLEFVIANADVSLHPKFKESLNKIRTLRNIVFISLHPRVSPNSGLDDLPKNVLEELILSHTNPRTVAAAKLVNRNLRSAATLKAQIQSFQRGFLGPRPLLTRFSFDFLLNNDLFTLKSYLCVDTMDKVVKWLSQDKNDAKNLLIAHLIGFEDLNNENLEKLVELCPNIKYLYLNSSKLTSIKSLPPSLEIFAIKCPNLKSMPELPKSCRRFEKARLFDFM